MPKNVSSTTLFHAYAQYIFIASAKYQNASVKALVQYALSKHKQNPNLKSNREKKWLSSRARLLSISVDFGQNFDNRFHFSESIKLKISTCILGKTRGPYWSSIAHLSAEDMLKSVIIEEKKFKHSPWTRADNPLGPKF